MEKDLIDRLVTEFAPHSLEHHMGEIARQVQEEGKTFKEATGITDEMENDIYILAKQFYDQGKYSEAISLFQALCALNPQKFDYAYGLGASFHQNQEYTNALMGFYAAFTIDPANPMVSYFLADTFIRLHLPEQADTYLSLAIDLAETLGTEASNALAERCRLTKKTLRTGKEKLSDNKKI